MNQNDIKNQIHPPRPEKVRVNGSGSTKFRLWFKSGTSTMLFCDNITKVECELVKKRVSLAMHDFHTSLKGTWLITK